MYELEARKRARDELVDLICRAHLDELRRAADEVRRGHIRLQRQIPFGRLEVTVLLDGRRVDRRRHHTERERDIVGRHDGFQEQPQLRVQVGEATRQIRVVVGRQVPRMRHR